MAILVNDTVCVAISENVVAQLAARENVSAFPISETNHLLFRNIGGVGVGYILSTGNVLPDLGSTPANLKFKEEFGLQFEHKYCHVLETIDVGPADKSNSDYYKVLVVAEEKYTLKKYTPPRDFNILDREKSKVVGSTVTRVFKEPDQTPKTWNQIIDEILTGTGISRQDDVNALAPAMPPEDVYISHMSSMYALDYIFRALGLIWTVDDHKLYAKIAKETATLTIDATTWTVLSVTGETGYVTLSLTPAQGKPTGAKTLDFSDFTASYDLQEWTGADPVDGEGKWISDVELQLADKDAGSTDIRNQLLGLVTRPKVPLRLNNLCTDSLGTQIGNLKLTFPTFSGDSPSDTFHKTTQSYGNRGRYISAHYPFAHAFLDDQDDVANPDDLTTIRDELHPNFDAAVGMSYQSMEVHTWTEAIPLSELNAFSVRIGDAGRHKYKEDSGDYPFLTYADPSGGGSESPSTKEHFTFQLTQDMAGASASADIFEMDGTTPVTTGATVWNTLNDFSHLVDEDWGICIKDNDQYWIIHPEDSYLDQAAYFELDEDLDRAENSTAQATVLSSIGPAPTTITVVNKGNHRAFETARGWAIADDIEGAQRWWIVNVNEPAINSGADLIDNTHQDMLPFGSVANQITEFNDTIVDNWVPYSEYPNSWLPANPITGESPNTKRWIKNPNNHIGQAAVSTEPTDVVEFRWNQQQEEFEIVRVHRGRTLRLLCQLTGDAPIALWTDMKNGEYKFNNTLVSILETSPVHITGDHPATTEMGQIYDPFLLMVGAKAGSTFIIEYKHYQRQWYVVEVLYGEEIDFSFVLTEEPSEGEASQLIPCQIKDFRDQGRDVVSGASVTLNHGMFNDLENGSKGICVRSKYDFMAVNAPCPPDEEGPTNPSP